ncbi:hypothetical protein BDZ97DRAFT_1918558 [Flammula alnicola]|nr:hypothetical protein BDZ97DRAFT_1918558 [Flammula alnicola]
MVAPSRSGPITKLNRDILWYIFCMNADLDDPIADRRSSCKALITAGRTSSVCRLWREIMLLDSACLWSKIIDLNLLARPGDEWRQEVLDRTGNAPLDIKGRDLVTVNEGNALRFFLSALLPAQWTRIRRFDLEVKDGATASVDETLWDSIQQSAPYLETFSLQFGPHLIPAVLESSNSVLFSDHAPLLHQFRLSCKHININFNAHWLSQIHTLALEGGFQILDLLKGLRRMPLLQDLTISAGMGQALDLDVDDGHAPHISPITLPKLQMLRLRVTISAAALFLGNTTAAPGCCLQLDVRFKNIHFPLSQEELGPFHGGLLRYMQGYFLSNADRQNEGLRMDLTDYRAHFRDSLPYGIEQPSIDSDYLEYLDAFVINIIGERRTQSLSSSLICLLLNVVSECHFPSSIKMLNLNVGNRKLYSGIDDLNRFLLALSSVEEMHTSVDVIKAMLDGHDQEENTTANIPLRSLRTKENTTANIPLRSLRTIRLEPLKSEEECRTTERFISWRREFSMPLAVENLRSITNFDYIRRGTNCTNGRPSVMRLRSRHL